jgi:hypothetical protein
VHTDKRLGITLAAVCALALCHGCRPGKTPQEEDGQRPDKQRAKGSPAEKPPLKHKIPLAVLSKEVRDTCLVWVGDPMPTADLPDLQGKAQPLQALFGKRLTFVGFWTAADSESAGKGQEMLESLDDLEKPFAKQGVAAIAVNVGNNPETAAKVVAQAEAKFPNLVDPQGAFFAKVAKGKLPRIYLLDSAGRIIWADVEYSGFHFRREVVPAIADLLAEKPAK